MDGNVEKDLPQLWGGKVIVLDGAKYWEREIPNHSLLRENKQLQLGGN